MQAERAQNDACQLSHTLSCQQGQLDQHAREALRAAMGLDKCTASLSRVSPMSCEGAISSLRMDMDKHLASLKDSLWQLLVLASSDNEVVGS